MAAGYEVGFDHLSMHMPYCVIGQEFIVLQIWQFVLMWKEWNWKRALKLRVLSHQLREGVLEKPLRHCGTVVMTWKQKQLL